MGRKRTFDVRKSIHAKLTIRPRIWRSLAQAPEHPPSTRKEREIKRSLAPCDFRRIGRLAPTRFVLLPSPPALSRSTGPAAVLRMQSTQQRFGWPILLLPPGAPPASTPGGAPFRSDSFLRSNLKQFGPVSDRQLPSIEDGKAAAEDVPGLADTRRRAQPGAADPIRRAIEEAPRSAGLMKWRGSSPKPAKGSNKPDARQRPACSEVPFA